MGIYEYLWGTTTKKKGHEIGEILPSCKVQPFWPTCTFMPGLNSLLDI